MVTTDRADLDTLVRTLRDHGASKSDLARHSGRGGFLLPDYDRVGFNYRMTDIQGALGNAQMARVATVLEGRAARARVYDELLRGRDWIARPVVPEGMTHGWQSYVCLFQPKKPTLGNLDTICERRNAIMADLEERGIATRQGTHAPVLTGFYRGKYGLRAESFPNAVIAERASISLPLYPQMTEDEQRRVVTELDRAFEAS
jgi:dTDP-4-amino-4,6-dideoxygalactose transaminase